VISVNHVNSVLSSTVSRGHAGGDPVDHVDPTGYSWRSSTFRDDVLKVAEAIAPQSRPGCSDLGEIFSVKLKCRMIHDN
jgi:hypothetical protein